eukprot:3514207-Ditylum_brightwellii.AAC.1
MTGNLECWEDVPLTLQTVYNKHHTDPILQILINSSMTDEHLYDTMNLHPIIDWSHYRDIIHKQSALGWEQI